MAQLTLMTFAQYEHSIHWFFDKVECDATNPQPRIRWLGEDPVGLQNGWPPDIASLQIGELEPTLAALSKVLKHILAARPVLTRVLLNQIDGYLTDPARRQKTARISNMFPNQEGLQGGSDGYLSLIDCATACLAGTEVCLQRWDGMVVRMGKM